MRYPSDREGAAAAARTAPSGATAAAGGLPEWNLADLYPSMDAPELADDMARALNAATEFEATWRGKLSAEAERGGAGRLGTLFGVTARGGGTIAQRQ